VNIGFVSVDNDFLGYNILSPFQKYVIYIVIHVLSDDNTDQPHNIISIIINVISDKYLCCHLTLTILVL